jgi:uncharacterized phage protein gp47/JayE
MASSYYRPTLSVIQSNMQNYLQSADLGGTGTVPAPNSPLMILGTLIADLINSNYAYQDWIIQQAIPYTATGIYLEGWAALKGIFRDPATQSTGVINFNGTSNVVIPAGTTVTTSDGNQFTTQSVYVIGTTTNVTILSNNYGTVSPYPTGNNYPPGVALSLFSPIIGVSNVVLSGSIYGGTDVQTDASLQTEMLTAYASALTGGSVQDFVNWQMQVPGVTAAFVYPYPNPATNLVVCYPFFDVIEAAYNGFPQGTNGGAAADPRTTPATGDQLTVANYLATVRPVSMIPFVTAPIAQPINVVINPLITTTTAVENAITAAITQMLITRRTPLGGIIYLSDFYGAIASVANVSEFALTSPSADVTTVLGNVATLGSIVFN